MSHHVRSGARLEVLAMVVVHYEETQSPLRLGTLQTYARDLLPLRDPLHQSSLSLLIRGGHEGRIFRVVMELHEMGLVGVSPEGILPLAGAGPILKDMDVSDHELVMGFACRVVRMGGYLSSRFTFDP